MNRCAGLITVPHSQPVGSVIRKRETIARMSSNLAGRVFLACSVISSLLSSRVEGGSVSLAWNPNPDPSVLGYTLHYGLASDNYTATLDAGANLSMTVEGLDEGATYFFAVSAYGDDGMESSNSEEVSGTVPYPSLILFEPSSQTAQAGAVVVISVDAIGAPPVTFQWFNGVSPITGGTHSLLTLSKISDADDGNYTVVVSDSNGSVTSAVATVTVVDSRSVLDAIPGALGTLLRADGASVSGKLLAEIAAPNLAALIASAAGTYNGLFYQTDDGGMPAIAVQTAGLLTQCVVDAQGNYAGAIYVDGLSNSISGAFNAAGTASATVGRAAAGLSDLGVALHLDLTAGALQMTGIVSNLDQGDPWTAVLTAEPGTNAFGQSPNFFLFIPPMNGLTAGYVTGVEGNGVVSLLGMMGDGTAFSQDAPVSSDGNMPLFIQLYGQSGLLAGWVNVFGSPATSLLTWICPSGQTSSGFTNVVEATITPSIATVP